MKACINYTPYANLTDNELLREVWNRGEASDLEIELAERLDYYIEYAATLMEESAPPVKARYKEEVAA